MRDQPIERLLDIMKTLRDAQRGCAWDREQTLASLTRHTLEEAYEVVDCIERGALDELPDELGDLLFQVVFYAQIAAEEERFDFTEVSARIVDKLLRRHPHVFGDEPQLDAGAQARRWEALKAAERRAAGAVEGELTGVPLALPALTRAAKLQGRAARVGFDWETLPPVFAKVEEELLEVRAAVAEADQDAIAAEVGDLLFTCVNLARHLGVDAETALRRASARFAQRFGKMERAAEARGSALSNLAPDVLEDLWNQAKRGQ